MAWIIETYDAVANTVKWTAFAISQVLLVLIASDAWNRTDTTERMFTALIGLVA